ncbi:MAG: 2-C-methyl-D-erythritol 2,4-cyclodiphosphate synthase [Leptospira sp.]|nr:2-C-methyl-D-erythritol 2,4-cyclodiphosphate synthase [Leptospira sp.]
MYRIGNGIDFHRLVLEPFRPLILGGVELETEFALLGHSDADIVLHSIGDAILGAMAEGDIGDHFPDTDPSLKGMDSKDIIVKCRELMKANQYTISNVDVTIVSEKPKISPYRLEIRKSLAELLNLELNQVSLKATTMEGMGSLGRSEGMMVMSSVLLEK